MPKKWAGDPVTVAQQLWAANGWPDTVHGMAAVTSLGRVTQLLDQQADAILSPLELSFARYKVLVVLYFNPERVSMSFIAQALQLHQATVTGLVDKLVKQELIERQAHPQDRRATLVQLTDKGRKRTRIAVKRLNTGLFSQLGLDEEQLSTLVSLLTVVRRTWDDVQEGSNHASGADVPLAQPSA